MRVLWLCNIILPKIASRMGVKASNKEGWLSGAAVSMENTQGIELGICFPTDKEHDGFHLKEGIEYFGFYENTAEPEVYDPSLEDRLSVIVESFRPDIVHIFGTEYPHTLAMARVMGNTPNRVLVGIQGVMDICKSRYLDGVPKRVVNRVTLRDFLRHDSLKQQQKKFELRAINEVNALKLVGNVTGRTPFDKEFTERINPKAKYHFMNETLRPEFYEAVRSENEVEKYSVFLSQGNYPIKGAHYMLEALADIRKDYPEARVYIAGDNITRQVTLKEKLKLSSYGKYLLWLIKKYELDSSVIFLGSLGTKEYIDRLKRANVFVCPSTIENSPNSLGEAMLLGVPCVTAEVGGIPGIFGRNRDGIMYPAGDVNALACGIKKIFSDSDLAEEFAENASRHAKVTHNPEINSGRLLDIYKEIFDANCICV